jgi:hypothetical protein
MQTFDLTTQDGAADAAHHLALLIGQPVTIRMGERICARGVLGSVHVWPQRNGEFSLTLNFKHFPHGFSGEITVTREDQAPEPTFADPRRQAAYRLATRPLRRD